MKNRLEELRKQRGIKQEDLANALEVSRQTIGSLENGRYNPSIQLAFKIARYFNMSIMYIERKQKIVICLLGGLIMKKRLLILMTVTGMIILLGGLLTYGLGVHEIIPVPRPDLIVVGTSLIGILLIVSGVCDLFVKKTKEMEIEENDERNISLSNAAMASGFKVMNVTIAVSIFALIFTGYMTVVPCFTIIGAYAIGQIVFIVRLWYLHKTM